MTLKNNKNPIFTLIAGLMLLSSAQAEIISFDIKSTSKYERVIEQKLDGSYHDDTDWFYSDSAPFTSTIEFDLFSEHNISQTQDEHHSENDLAWWMTMFEYTSQDIYTPFESSLLSLVSSDEYEYIDDQYRIFAGGTYHYYDPESDSDVREHISFRRELNAYNSIQVEDGDLQVGFSYWQQFTVRLPNPLSFDAKTYFDSFSTNELLAEFSGSQVEFETYLDIQSWWHSHDRTEFSYKFNETGYVGSGTYSYNEALKVPEPGTAILLLPFALLLASRRK